jgi:hypothetical protein
MRKNFREEEYYTYSYPRSTWIKTDHVFTKESYNFPQNMDAVQYSRLYIGATGVNSNLPLGSSFVMAYRKYNEPYLTRTKDSTSIFLTPAKLSEDGFRKLRYYITPRSI